jgi:hypothetical protein
VTGDGTLSAEYEAVCNDLDAHWDEQAGADFQTAVARLRALAERGNLEAAEYLAEILALYGPLHDPAEAYTWYYVALSQQGYAVAFADENGMAPHYCGPVGDFRNESMVSGLVAELGFQRVQQLDIEAAQWLAKHGLAPR